MNNAPPRIDAFAAAIGIDQLRDNNIRQRTLVNVDDGTKDGNLRKKAFPDDPAPGKIHTVDGERGTGPKEMIDMRDLRVYRDAWTQIHGKEQNKVLDGPSNHLKKDLNMDGCVNHYQVPGVPGVSCSRASYKESDHPRYAFSGGSGIAESAIRTSEKVSEFAVEPFKVDPDTDCKGVNVPEGCFRDIDVMEEMWDGDSEQVVTEDVDEDASGRCSPPPEAWSDTGLLMDRNEDDWIDYLRSFDVHGKVQDAQTLHQPKGLYHASATQSGLPKGAESPFPGRAGAPFDPTGLVVRSLGEDFIKCREQPDESWEGVVTVPTVASGGSPSTVDLLYQAKKERRVGTQEVTDNRYLHVQAQPKLGEDLAMDASFNALERLRSTERGQDPFPKKQQLEIVWRKHPNPQSKVAGEDPAFWTSKKCLPTEKRHHDQTVLHKTLVDEARRVFIKENTPQDNVPDLLLQQWRDLDDSELEIVAPIASSFTPAECRQTGTDDHKARLLGAWVKVGRPTIEPPTFQIAAGSGATCAVDAETGYCWGSNRDGRLGVGTDFSSLRQRTTPSAVSGGHPFTHVSTNWGSVCGMTKEGKAYCWGHGQPRKPIGETTGYGGDTGHFSSTPAQVLKGKTIAQIHANEGLTCAVTRGGVAYCWGLGYAGNGTPHKFHPKPVRVPDISSFVQVIPHSHRTCGITSDGTTYCWGQVFVRDPNIDRQTSGSPKEVPEAPAFVQIAHGATTHTCGLTADGTVHCWGSGGPHLGIGQKKIRPMRATPQRVDAGDVRFKQLSSIVASGSPVCALATSGDVYCWGESESLGLDSATPVQVTEGIQFEQISVGAEHICGIGADGKIYCWGANGEGQLGDGTTHSSQTPVPVKGLSGEN